MTTSPDLETNQRRLGPDTPLPAGVSAPKAIPEGIGIVHLGWGAFHRAHQAVYTEDAMAASGDLRWGILGDIERSGHDVVDALRGQGGRFTVLTVGQGTEGNTIEEARVVGSVVDVADPCLETPRLLSAIAAPTTHVVTLTVTEKGYARRPDGHLDPDLVASDLVALAAEEAAGSADVSAAVPAASAMGLLVRGLAARRRAGGQAITVLSCDNMAENGVRLRRVVNEFVELALPSEAASVLRAWLASSTTWPCSMVDRITPAICDAIKERVAEVLGARDEACIAAEPFLQWVIEDNFIGPRPAWELAGAELTDNVASWENAKLRMLNGTHSLIAYAGRLFGYATIAEAVAAAEITEHARAYMFNDALPSITPPAGADLPAYGRDLLYRFANPATGHTTRQVSTDGTQKIPFRWGGVLRDHLAAGRVPLGVAFGLAAWSEFVRRATRDGVDLGDPASEATLAATVAQAGADNAVEVAKALIALPGLLPVGAGTDPSLVGAVVSHVEALVAASDTVL
jgi:fructuronate reductase